VKAEVSAAVLDPGGGSERTRPHTHTDSDTDLDELERRAVAVGMDLREDVYLAVAAGSCCSPRGRSR
jgi:hypothetical protein